MKEIVLIGASWCGSCHAMREWFNSVDIPGVVLQYMDIEELKDFSVSSVPAVLFKDSGEIIQAVYGAMSKNDLIHKASSIFGGN